MGLTARQLNRATLARQLLLGRESLGVVDGVRRVVAIQAQQPASPYVALFNRLDGFDPAALDAAFAERAVVKGTLMRITLHAVAADDHALMHRAMQPTLRTCLGDERYTAFGLTADDADGLADALLEFIAQPRTSAECLAFFHPEVAQGAWFAVRRIAPVTHAPSGGPWTYGPRNAYIAGPPAPPDDPEVALAHLVRRYLEGFGPATVADIAQFALVPQARVKRAIDGLETIAGPDDTTLLDVPGGVIPDEDVPAPPRLMAMWDSVLLAYKDRARVVPPEYRAHVTRRNGDVLPTLLVDGRVAGVWRPREHGIEATAFHALDDETWTGLAEEATALIAFLADREPLAYSRYHHWWDKLPAGDVRVLGG